MPVSPSLRCLLSKIGEVLFRCLERTFPTLLLPLQLPPEEDDEDDDEGMVRCQVVVPLFTPTHPSHRLVLVGSSAKLGK